MQNLEGFLHSTYTFCFSPKKHLEAMQACSIVGEKVNTLLCNIKMMWISMLSLAKKVLEKYKSLIVRMNYDFHTISYVKTTLEFLYDILRLSWASLSSCLCWKL